MLTAPSRSHGELPPSKRVKCSSGASKVENNQTKKNMKLASFIALCAGNEATKVRLTENRRF